LRTNRAGPQGAAQDAGVHIRTPCSVDSSDATMNYKKYMCIVCGWIYDEQAGAPDHGIPPGTRWEELPLNWTCPDCGAAKGDFEMLEID